MFMLHLLFYRSVNIRAHAEVLGDCTLRRASVKNAAKCSEGAKGSRYPGLYPLQLTKFLPSNIHTAPHISTRLSALARRTLIENAQVNVDQNNLNDRIFYAGQARHARTRIKAPKPQGPLTPAIK
jgi:hypothetical protein